MDIAKPTLVCFLDAVGLLRADLARRGFGEAIAVNYHATPTVHRDLLKQHFAFYSRHFECLSDEDAVLRLLDGSLRLHKPGVVICFDDGFRDNAEVAAPLLERFGMRGWFMLPGGAVAEVERGRPILRANNVRVPHVDSVTDVQRATMTWEDARALAERGHVIGCHTWTHRPLGRSTPAVHIEAEVVRSRFELEQRLGRRVRTFCWVRGRVCDYSINAHREVVRTYDLAFASMGRAMRAGTSPHAIHRFNVEASFRMPLVRFQISRFNEVVFARRRHLVDEILGLRRESPPAQRQAS